MAGPFQNSTYTTTNNLSPYLGAAAVTPNDGADLPGGVTRALFVGSTGTINVVMADGSTVSFTIPSTATGIAQNIAVKRVNATGTTATNIVALY